MHSSMLCNTREVQRNIMCHFYVVYALPTLKGKKQVMLDVGFLPHLSSLFLKLRFPGDLSCLVAMDKGP